MTLFETYRSVALLRALDESGRHPWKISDHQGQESGLKVAICASIDTSCWEWKGVFAAPFGTEPSDPNDETSEKSRYVWNTLEMTLV